MSKMEGGIPEAREDLRGGKAVPRRLIAEN